MINAHFSRSGDAFSLEVTGHAEYACSGDDVVCAAASGIVYALAGYVINECEGAAIHALRSGEASIECGRDGEAAMRMAYIGLVQLAVTYPGFVRVGCDAWKTNVGKARDAVA